ncbi:MAG: hypothetical protein CTY16_13085 [Methylobacter sp.]|nr:MAG: hypothetical protein CTY16_13085 [Methylobacter sp.]
MKTYTLFFVIACLALSGSFANAVEEQQKTMTEKEMQEKMTQMEKELAEIRQTKDPKERKQMMDQHMQHMHDMMMNDGCCAGDMPMMGHEPKQ